MKTILAIVAIFIIIVICIFTGIDGALVGTGIAIIAGLAGYGLGKVQKS